MKVISCALALEYKITSGDHNLIQFVKQEFKEDFKGDISPLEIINLWIESGLVQWNTVMQKQLSLWAYNNENPQPPRAKKKFYELTGNKYTGS